MCPAFALTLLRADASLFAPARLFMLTKVPPQFNSSAQQAQEVAAANAAAAAAADSPTASAEEVRGVW